MLGALTRKLRHTTVTDGFGRGQAADRSPYDHDLIERESVLDGNCQRRTGIGGLFDVR
jgi:hypothetical protein